MLTIVKKTGKCHCGSFKYEATFKDGLKSASRCNCSYCRMRGAVVVGVSMNNFRVLEGADVLTTYKFHSKSVRHFFCSRCGIYTHHERRSREGEYGVNTACLEGVSPFDFSEVIVYDGENHTKDTGKPAKVAGILRYVPADL